jgi:hypothetical protein
VLLWPTAEAEAFTAAEAFTEALRATVLYRTDQSILGVDFVMVMIASAVISLRSVTPGPGIMGLRLYRSRLQCTDYIAEHA